jgi:protein O-GlcNAc transferase
MSQPPQYETGGPDQVPTAADADTAFLAAVEHHHAGRLAEAEAGYRLVLTIAPDDVGTIGNLAILFRSTGRNGAAALCLRRLIELQPDNRAALLDLARLLRGAADTVAEAMECYRRAIALKPDDAGACCDLAAMLVTGGDLDEAERWCRQALAVSPDLAEAVNNLAAIATARRRWDEAATAARRAVELAPGLAEAHNNLGVALHHLHRTDEAIARIAEAIRLRPDLADAHNAMGIIHESRDEWDEAAECFRTAIRHSPAMASAHNNLGNALKGLGRLDQVEACYRRAIAIAPDFIQAHSNLVVTLPFLSDHDGATVLAAAREAGAAMTRSGVAEAPIIHANVRDPDRRLRIGYLSPSLRAHVVAPYLAPVLRAHRRDQVSVHVYAHVPEPDSVTRDLQDLADAWTFIHDLPDGQAAAQVAADRIDILVDPMGHWGETRLGVFARKPAPVQVSYLCQGPTTGLSQMDYIIGDHWLNGDGAMQRGAAETVVELPSGFQVTSFNSAPGIGEPPMLANGFVTFGSFNNAAKLSDASLVLWAGVLAACPGSRLLIKSKGLDRPANVRELRNRMTAAGLPPDRVDMIGWLPGQDHLAAHGRVDIMLDTTPFTGGRTSLEALWMGVPVVTLAGAEIHGRFTHSHLCRAGFPELTAFDPAGYRDIAVGLAGDRERLRHYRRTLRPAIQASSLLDAATHVAELEHAFRAMWRVWCKGG